MQATVYTAIFGNYDNLKAPSVVERDADYVFLTDWEKAVPAPWQKRIVKRKFKDNRRESRRCKILAHEFFPGPTIWHGGNIQLNQLPSVVLEKMLGDAEIAAFRHPHRSCLYEEAEICKDWKLDSAEKIDKQMARYRREGFPAKFGLTACWFLIRRNTDRVREFDNMWWKELSSIRDQLSFDYVRWKTGMKVKWLNGCLISHPWFKRYTHK